MAILDNIRNIMNKVIRIVCILLFAFMIIIGTYQILVRYIFNSAKYSIRRTSDHIHLHGCPYLQLPMCLVKENI